MLREDAGMGESKGGMRVWGRVGVVMRVRVRVIVWVRLRMWLKVG